MLFSHTALLAVAGSTAFIFASSGIGFIAEYLRKILSTLDYTGIDIIASIRPQ